MSDGIHFCYDDEVGKILRELDLPHLSQGHSSLLIRPLSFKEVEKVIFDMNGSSSPGPDGITSEFFKVHWGRVRESVFQAVNRFFESGYILKEWNQSLLVMIPKIATPEEVGHLRPIRLCNTIYKCASK